jgi:ectoine hydroxylase-related dioxygenase (phytanoyl-CoA dioxygenase family)
MKARLDFQNQLPSSQITQRAVNLFKQHGALWLERVFCPEAIEALRISFQKRFEKTSRSDLVKRDALVGDQRYMMTVDIKGKFNRPEVYANDRLMPLLKGLLSPNFRIASFGCVTALPGAEDQSIHLDHPPLFEATPHLTDEIPPYAVTMVVPLVDIDEEMGTTAIWEGSHRQAGDFNGERKFELLERLMEEPDYSAAAKPLPRQGDVYLMDYRVIHGGLANRSQIDRPILYVVYSRRWFRDGFNFSKQPSVSISAKQLKKVPKEYRGLFT